MQISKKILTAVLSLFITTGLIFPAEAQFQQPGQQEQTVNVSDSELTQFYNALSQLQVVQSEAQQEMLGVIQENGMDVETFNELYSQTAQGQTPENISRDDLVTFESVTEQVMEIQQEVEVKMTKTIEDNGLEVQRYQQILMAVQQDTELQQRLNNMQ